MRCPIVTRELDLTSSVNRAELALAREWTPPLTRSLSSSTDRLLRSKLPILGLYPAWVTVLDFELGSSSMLFTPNSASQLTLTLKTHFCRCRHFQSLHFTEPGVQANSIDRPDRLCSRSVVLILLPTKCHTLCSLEVVRTRRHALLP